MEDNIREDIKDLEEIMPKIHRKYRNALTEIINQVRRNCCTYERIEDDYNIWSCSQCKCEWVLEEGNPVDNNMNFCPECGARINNIIEIAEEE